MSTLILSAADVDRVVSQFTPKDLVQLMAKVFWELNRFSQDTQSNQDDIVQPHRLTIPMQNHTALFMPSRIASFGTAIKVVSVPTATAPPEVRQRGLPASTLVFDETTGAVNGIVNAGTLTALRNAAGSLLATRTLLYPVEKYPRKLVAFGAGAQIAAHLSLFLDFYFTITEVAIFNRSKNARVSSLIASLKAKFGERVAFSAHILPAVDGERAVLQQALHNADIVITATSSTEPLFPSSFISSGTHLCLIGSYKPSMHEIDTDLVRRAGTIVVDSREACKTEAGELIAAKVADEDLVELGSLFEINEQDPTSKSWTPHKSEVIRLRSKGDVTIFKSVGVGIQDVAIAHAVVARAKSMGVGTYVDL
ncbi:unnamed protein product [Somion occarium]|uniref:Ornithine cyclodeaminase n=1 Tax=Somion occarium TaxID=3059160 RepID=A0ABP1D6B5_9APHY